MAAPVFHTLTVHKPGGVPGVLEASCSCGEWKLNDPDGDFVTAEYRAHKARAAKETT